ncbi:glycosyltransferase family 2 protein [Actinopolymorpha singaporensis]|uniref:Glycosyltransferase, GT2 family n=1 Tax=Actinopolymorpha singaporensis TaxID=117157 RepID=A0A1H1RC65_9ACTN|nr:glycosyltransferase [Actinopolymorpha singaporensis]SDS32509.1 Glycosyltransferase, GT2 family [Actinopolymorpha singaporensis]
MVISERLVPASPGAHTSVVVMTMTRDRAEGLAHMLNKLADLSPNTPVIVVDNGSSDETAQLVLDEFPRVSLVRLRENAGAPARNVGVQRAQTPYVAFSDDDSWWAQGALDEAARRFEDHPRLGLLAARTLVGPDEHPDPLTTLTRDSPMGRATDLPGPTVRGFLACSAVVRRSAFLHVGGFNDLLFFMGEETMLAYDLMAAGWGVAYVEEVTAHHHPAPSRGPSSQRLAMEERNSVLTAWMRRPVKVALQATTAKLAASAVTRHPSRGALPQALRRLPSALRQRSVLPEAVEAQVRLVESGDRP